ncbi:MAG: hydrogenase 3 maturation endopeptidase HyCI [Candidatus Nezhaarchaeota archaeon]|nr:hydrogenase 3 maturation endopeptidase HyCI [Candidatus Nezhaarchaeota archaeon]
MWKKLSKVLLDELTREKEPLVVVLCVGNDERGDDGLGPYVARSLKRGKAKDFAKIIDSGNTPENYTSVIRNIKPTHVVIVDAVDFGGSPGDVVLSLDPKFDEVTISSHRPSFTMLAKYIEAEVGSKVILLGAQPKNLEIGSPMSGEVVAAANLIVKAIKSAFKGVEEKRRKHVSLEVP